jgi:hypothetical protein
MGNDGGMRGLKLDHIGKNLFGRSILALPCTCRYLAECEWLGLSYRRS